MKKEKILSILDKLSTTENEVFHFEKDVVHTNAYNLEITDNEDGLETCSYNIAVLDDCVCFHRFSIRGSVFMYFAEEDDEELFDQIEFASTHPNYLEDLPSTKTILESIVPLLEELNEEED